jgi:integral membrane protein (TIGR01906 family)
MAARNDRPDGSVESRGRALYWVARALFYIAIPLALVTTNVRFAFNEERVYQYSIDHYEVPATTGFARADLIAATQDVRAYFNNSADYLRTRVHDPTGAVVPLFNTKEVLHMRDVKALVHGVYDAEAFALCVIAAYVVGVCLWSRAISIRTLARQALKGAVATVVLLVVFGIAGATGFDSLFIRFHEIAFSNSNWLLDPARDHLVQMFPEGFWLDVTMLIAGLTILEALLLGGGAWLYLRRHPEPAPAATEPADRGGERSGDVAQPVA